MGIMIKLFNENDRITKSRHLNDKVYSFIIRREQCCIIFIDMPQLVKIIVLKKRFRVKSTIPW